MPRTPRRLLNPRWIAAALVILVLAGVCVQLGRWQLHRLDERKARNEVTRSNLAAPPAPLAEVLGPQRVVGDQHDWRTAVVTGRYDASKQVVMRYRNVDDRPGFEIVTPLVLADGSAVLVDRGFLPRQGAELAPGNVPAVPSGEVTVTGRLRRSERGGHTSGGTPVDGTARLINGPEFASALGLTLYDGYLTVDRQVPAADSAFGGFPGPEIDDGPHFFYALQWFFFALMAVGGLVYFSRQDVNGDKSEDGSQSDGTSGGTGGEGGGGEGGSGAGGAGGVGGEGGSEPETVPAGPADRGLRADRGPADGGPGLD
ncbi:SURF1 family protein [Kribbella qitaiheensis]|uniref:SURF1 family cytochrome oxidase biogenesis protein n=1 Tax=Kribbella qitaiheensis TaxID=1544730 RepID=UPI00360A7003